MKGIVINLDRREDRYNNFKKEFGNILDISKISAVDSLNINYDIKYPNLKYLTNRKNVLACCLSHIEVYKKIVSEYSESEYAFVFEDDCRFIYRNYKTNFESIIKDVLSKAPSDFGVIYLNKSIKDKPLNLDGTIDFKLLTDIPNVPTSESYIINKKYAAELIKYLSNNYGAIDHKLKNFITDYESKQNKKIGYILNNPIFCQNNRLDTDIQKRARMY